jgi:hypothetical protein
MAAKLVVRKIALQELENLAKAGVEVQFLGSRSVLALPHSKSCATGSLDRLLRSSGSGAVGLVLHR